MKKVRILIVEDEGLVARDIENMVKSLGYSVCSVVSTGEEAIEKAEKMQPDLVLMDIILKGEIDGVEAAEKIRGLYDIPVIYLTAHTDENTFQRAKVTEPFGYALKPIEHKELMTAIEMALYKHKMEMKLVAREEWLTTILRSIGDAVIATDKEGSVTFMNPVAEILTGWTLEASVKKPLANILNLVIEDTGQKVSFSARCIVQNEPWIPDKGNLLIVRKVGKTSIEVSTTCLRDEKEEVSGIVLVLHDMTERRLHEEQLKRLAIHDQLTELPNRVLFYDRLDLALSHAKRNHQRLALIMLDLDYFKKVNDTLGHQVGDILLKSVAKRLRSSLRASDTVARLGGDEFVILLPEIYGEEDAVNVGRRMLVAFQTPFDCNGQSIQITASIGIAISPEDGQDPDSLSKNADLAMYQAKEDGRNRFQVHIREIRNKAQY